MYLYGLKVGPIAVLGNSEILSTVEDTQTPLDS